MLLLLVIALGVLGVGWYTTTKQNSESSVSPLSLLTLPSPSPIPFADLTIPYLRGRSYASKLGELARYSDTTSYTLYLTSYASDGLRVNGLLTVPKGQMPEGGWPGIVFVHGYIAPSIYETTERYNDYVNSLAREGFVVFKIDLRGHGDSEGEAGGAYYSGDYVIDTLNAYEALSSSELVNDQKVGLWGHSMAGNVTFRAFVAKKDIPAVAIWAGAGFTYEDLREYRIMDASYRAPEQSTERARKRQELRELYGEFDANHPFWKQVSPVNYLDGIEGALALHHAVDDSVVSVDYSRNLTTLLEKTAIEHEFREYGSGGHNLTGGTFTQAMRNTVDFYNTYLK